MAGTLIADTLTHSTAGSIATNYVVEGSCKSWIYFEQAGTHEAYDSFNISSITDAGTGRSYPVSFTTNLGNANYAGTTFQSGSSTANNYLYFSNQFVGGFGNKTSSQYGVRAYASSGDIDVGDFNVVIQGDLA